MAQTSPYAQQYDFFAGGDAGDAGIKTPAGWDDPAAVAERERQRIAANRARGLDPNGNPLPAFGTPASQGGTATGYQVTSQNVGGYNATQGRRNTMPTIGVQQGDFNHQGEFQAGLNPDQLLGSGGGGRMDLNVADSLAGQVTGASPTVAPQNRVTQENINALTPVIDPMLERNAEVDRAFAMSEDLVNRVLNAPSQTGLLADQMLSNMLAVGRSAPGGIGAAQGGVKAALGAAPQVQRDAQQASIQEQQARASAATGAAQIYAGVAGTTADRAVRIQEANQRAATAVIGNLTQLTGYDYSFDTAKMGAIGQLARDYFNNAQQFASLDLQKQMAQWDDMTKRYGIDKSFEAAVQQIAAQKNIGPLDAFKLVLGGITGIGGLVAGAA